MKLTTTKQSLLSGLTKVKGAISASSTLPILANVLLEADADGLKLTATDLDMTISARVDACAGAEGAITLPAKRLYAIARELPEESVDIDGGTIRCGRSRFTVAGLGKDEFPAFVGSAPLGEYTLGQKALGAALRLTAFAASDDETRYVLNGVLFDFAGDMRQQRRLDVVATDGRRLAHHAVDCSGDGAHKFILPNKAVAELAHLLGQEGDVVLTVGEGAVTFSTGAATLKAKVVDGTYPDWCKVLPPPPAHTITLERAGFLGAVSRASLFATDKAGVVKLRFAQSAIVITSEDLGVGEAHETFDVEHPLSGEVAYDAGFLMDPLKHLTEDEVTFGFSGSDKPAMICTSGYTYVLMPMRIDR